ncbi:hypothetical protein [Methylovirgula sp. HY1]|uniref:hypothetical protein n=1 Tax=Methylovirgula sp. HY1 TaxID=2822761 RepID=UPI001C5B07CB|nr:hypothetical protein [Methylovirgula sp. HY1]QXX73454.1 hypothetical protein MHY1_00250 [Methylovirgula sp. HY1]
MVREFTYRGEIFRIIAHGTPGHEEVFIQHMEDGEEMGEISIDRMTEENDTSAPIEVICVDLCDRLIIEREINAKDPTDPEAAFAWNDTKEKIAFAVHNGLQEQESDLAAAPGVSGI